MDRSNFVPRCGTSMDEMVDRSPHAVTGTSNEWNLRQSAQVAQLVDYNNVLSGFDAGSLRLAGHGHEPDRQERLPVQFAVVLAQQHEFLFRRRPDRNNHPATVFELVNQ